MAQLALRPAGFTAAGGLVLTVGGLVAAPSLAALGLVVVFIGAPIALLWPYVARAHRRPGGLWRNVWVRAGVLHPFLFVAPWVVLSAVVAAQPGSDLRYVGWGLFAIPLAAIASFVATVVMAARRALPPDDRWTVALLGLVASGVALVVGWYGWLQAAEVACHGGYECPF
jgi:hypothetical protein